jgi:DNA-directed RNA polymerase specialized sigma24 family protein
MSDEQLMKRLKRTDKLKYFEHLHARYFDLLVRSLPVPREHATDYASDTLATVYILRHTFDGDFRSWLCYIASCLISDRPIASSSCI